MLKIRLLGEMAILRGGEPLAFPPSKKTRALLAYLVATGRPQRRERLCSMLWELPDDPRGALRWSLSKVRALVDEPDGASRVVADRETVAFVAEGTACDLHALREVAGRPLGSVPTALLQQVAADIGGEFLEGLDLPTQPDFQAWCLAERENARRQHAALLAELTLRLSSDAPEEAALHARRRVALEPYDEMAHVVLVDLLARAGRRQEAEQQCAAGVRLLGEAGIAADALTRAARALRIPPRRPPEAPLAAPMAPTEAAGAGAGGEGGPAGRLVIVDDEPEVGRMVAEYLTRHGFAVRAAMSGRELDALLAAEPADLLLLDVKMPGEDGFSIARRLQGRNGPPVLFLTAASDVIDRVVGLELGALDYITKPFDVRELRARVRNVLRRIDSERKASALAVNPDRPGAMTPAAGLIAAASARAESQATAAERKHVTLLVATVAEMKPEERRDVELSLRHLEPSLAAIGEILGRYGGAITTLQADSVTGAFGAPAAHEDDAASACFAALAMQETLRAHWPDLILRIGLHAGEIIVRPAVGAEHPTGIEAVGPAVRLAGRIAAIAASGIVLTGETVRRVNDIVTVVPLEPDAMPGLGAVRLYALTGRAAPRSRWDIRAARGLSPFCGRDIELETLRRALERVGAGHGEVVTIVGEPGMGKSRLVHEFLHALVPPSWGVLATATTFHDTHAAYRPIGNLLRSWLGVGERETQDEVAEKLAAHISGTRSTLAAHRPALLALLDLPVDDATWPALNPSQRRRATQDAIRAVLARESQLQPLVVLFEDLHWADAQTSNALDVLVETLGGLRLLLVVTHRPQHQHGWAGKSYVLQLRLDPFPAGTADALLQALLGPDTGLSALRRFLIARTEGVPLFLEEAVRALAENGALVGGPGNYRLATSVITLDLPPTVQAVLTARIDGLPPPAKTLLQTASVIGREVPWVLLRRIAGLPDQALQETLAALQSAEFLFEIHPPPDPVYVFKHALTQEAAYGGLLRDRRRTLHVELVHAIEECYRGRLDEQVDRLAEHALAGGLWDEAVRYVLQAANRAIARSAHRQAADLLERGLAALEHLPETAQRLRLELDYRKALGVTMMALRGWGSPEVSDAYTRARLLCERLGDERELFVALRGQGQFHMIRGELQTARALGQHCMAFAIRSNDNGRTICSGAPASSWATMPMPRGTRRAAWRCTTATATIA